MTTTPPQDDAREIVDEIRARFERNYTNMCLGAELSHIGQTQVVSDVGILLRCLDAAILSRIPSEEAADAEEIIEQTFVQSWDQHIGQDGAIAIVNELKKRGYAITRTPTVEEGTKPCGS